MLLLEKNKGIAKRIRDYCPASALKSQRKITSMLGSKIENVKPSIALSNMILEAVVVRTCSSK